MDKQYFNWLVDDFEAYIHANTAKNFNKRSSVTKRGGRPYMYSPRELGKQMVKHFRDCIENDRPFTITGLCWQLGISRRGLLNLEKSLLEEFVHTVKKGKLIVEIYLETQLYLVKDPKGIIFVLKGMGRGDNTGISSKRPAYALSAIEKAETIERMKHFSE
jgi:hypothetical protein